MTEKQMNDRQSDFTRRRFVAVGSGTVLAVLGLDLARGEVAARQMSGEEKDMDELEQAIQQMRAATVGFINGKTEAWKEMCSHRDDATLFGGWGGYEMGWEELGPRDDWAAARFAGGEMEFEEIARYASADLACTIHFERMKVRLTGDDAIVPVNLRVTHIYRREEDGWKLINRHADNIVTIQATDSVVDK
jgi:ketosteroid isomerase-like protein